MTAVAPRRRLWALFRAHVAADRAGLPWLAATTRGLATAVLLGLVRDVLPPFAFGVFAVALLMGWVAFALVGEWGHLLRADDEDDWLAALPATPLDRRLARTLHVVWLVLLLTLPSAVLAAALVPSTDVATRVLFGASLLGAGVSSAALLAFLSLLFAGRLQGVWMALQAFGIAGFLVGLLQALGSLDRLVRLPELGDVTGRFLWGVPPAWFAAPLGSNAVESWRLALPLVPTLVGLAALVLLPPARVERSVRSSWLDAVLRPVRALAVRLWVRPRERASFDLVADALPREREVVLRTYPMVALPLVFLVLAVGDVDDSRARADFLAVVLFGAALYLPVLITQVPISSSWEAAWLHDTAPTSNADLQLGALKAIVVRFVLPLYVLFALLTFSLRGGEAILRLTLPGFLVSVLAVVRLWPLCVVASPLSVAPEKFAPPTSWYASLLGWSMGLTFLAIFVERKVELWAGTLLFVSAVLVLEQLSERRLRAVLARGMD